MSATSSQAISDHTPEVPPGAAAATRIEPFQFTGTGGEYFRIWIVNLLLTVLTLGIYSAWAKVRRMRYFYGSTRLAGSAFEYHGKPLQILKGRLIAVGVVVVLSVLTTIWPLTNVLFVLLILFGTPWIKLEVIADDETLQPDVMGLVEAANTLIKDGFEVFPYCTEDLSVASRLVDAGCKVVMPWASPIGSARGITNRDALKLLRARFPDITLVVDAGIGAPSHAAEAFELGYDAVLLNTAIAKADDPVAMASAFRLAIEAGRAGYAAGLMQARDFASPSTPVVGTPFWHAVS